jgi:hypothetical protein
MAILNRSDLTRMGGGAITGQEICPDPERILSDPPRLAYIYKNAIRVFIFIPTDIYKNVIRVTHIYTSIFSRASSPFLFSQFCSSQTFSEKKNSLVAVSPSRPHAIASPANALSLTLPHAAFTPPLAPRSLTPPPVPPTLSLALPLTLPSRRHLPSITDLTSICYMPALLQYQMSKKKYHKICLQLIPSL